MAQAAVHRFDASIWASIAQTLTAQQARVLRLRFGHCHRPVPQKQVAAILGVPLWAVRQIEDDALHRLRLHSMSGSPREVRRDFRGLPSSRANGARAKMRSIVVR